MGKKDNLAETFAILTILFCFIMSLLKYLK